MKRNILLIILGLFLLIDAQAQIPPQAFNYSAVARDAQQNPIVNQTIGIQFTIRQTSTIGPVVYSENHFVNTDQYGLFNLIIGAGAIQSGSMSSINWSIDNYYLQIGMDANGGTNFLTMGTTQLISVPYAMHAATAGSLIGGGGSLSAPSVNTSSASNITTTSATLNGSVNANDLITIFDFQISTTPNFSQWSFPQASYSNTVSGTQITNVSENVTSLVPNTTYYYRLGGINAKDTTFGSTQSFTTLSGVPSASTYGDSIYANGDVVLFGSVNPNGASSTTVSFEYGPTLAYGSSIGATPSPIVGTSNISVQSNFIVGLTSGTWYNYRVVATNAFGTTYGNNQTFYYP